MMTGLFGAGDACAKDVVIHAGSLIDGGTTPRREVSILIRDEVIDLSTKTVLPGFIDTPDYISSTGSRRPLNRFVLTGGRRHDRRLDQRA